MTKEQATREALEMALEALETNNKAWKNLADSGDAGFWEAEEQPFYEIAVKAITAIKEALQSNEQVEPVIDGNTSDGYHTFNELYEFRKAYNVALFNEWAASGKCFVHKSWRHHDGELCFGGGWFIVVAILPQGQISNHYEAKDWDLFHIQETEKALFEFDGHTGADVIYRLHVYTHPPVPTAQPEQELTNLERHERNVQQLFGTPQPKEPEHIVDVNKKVAQPEQEPVAWVCHGVNGEHDVDFYQDEIDALPVGTMLYTSPPQRTWVGLTDEEKQTAIWSDGGFGAGALWAEAKIKEKNT